MKRMGMRALAMVGVFAVVLMVGSSAQAWRFRDRDRFFDRDVVREFRQKTHSHTRWCGHRDGGVRPAPSVPEPSAALVFGVGLLVARGFARRNR